MKKIILILVLFAFFGCAKKNKSLAPEEAYCIYENKTTTLKVFISCEKSKEDAQNRCVELRNEGKNVESIKKNTCSDC